MFIDEKDKLRKKYNVGIKSPEACIARNHGQLCIPVPALGEVYFKQYEKDREQSESAFKKLNQLIDKDVFKVRFIDEDGTAFEIAKKMMSKSCSDPDGRNALSPMDALILSVAIADPDSSVFYTDDQKLISNPHVYNIIEEYRDRYDNRLELRNISSLLR